MIMRFHERFTQARARVQTLPRAVGARQGERVNHFPRKATSRSIVPCKSSNWNGLARTGALR